jgi:hypothetical protein
MARSQRFLGFGGSMGAGAGAGGVGCCDWPGDFRVMVNLSDILFLGTDNGLYNTRVVLHIFPKQHARLWYVYFIFGAVHFPAKLNQI